MTTAVRRGLLLAGSVALGALVVSLRGGAARVARTPASGPADRATLVAMARLEPRGRVVRVSAAIDDVVARVLVAEGDEVAAGQPLAELRSRPIRETDYDAAKLKVARAALQPMDAEAQTSQLHIAEAELDDARGDVKRQTDLRNEGLASGRNVEEAQLRLRRAEEGVARAQTVLRQLRDGAVLAGREADVDVRGAAARLEQTIVRAPSAGTVLRLLVRPGERAGAQPILELGATRQMYAVAEVPAADIRLVKAGQRARFSSNALADPIDGEVEQVGLMISKNDIFGEDAGNARTRVFEVRVRLDDNGRALAYTNLDGQVQIFVVPTP